MSFFPFHNHTHDSNTDGHETPLSGGSLTRPSSRLSVASNVDDAEPSSSPISPPTSIPPIEPRLPRLTLNSFLPIVQQLGNALVEEDGEYRLVGKVDEKDMGHLRAYAARVEELNLSIPETPGASNSVYFHLGELRDGNKPLFPALTRLSITVSDDYEHDLYHLTLFLSPSLKSLSITNISTKARASLHFFLTTLDTNLLERIQFNTLELNSTLTSTILQCRNLRCIELNSLHGSLNLSDLKSVLVLPRLKHFTVDARSTSEPTPTAPSSPSPPSLSLEELHITGPSQLLLDLLHFIGAAATLSSIYCKISWNFLSFDPFLEIVGARHSQSLRQLILSRVDPGSYLRDVQRHLPKAHYNVLKSLTLLENLEIIDIPFENVNDALCSLTPGWPRMKRLYISLAADAGGRPVSLPTLCVVAQSCPQLTDLQCPLEIKSPDDPFSSFLLSHGLERLSPGLGRLSPVGGMWYHHNQPSQQQMQKEQFAIARYLYALFPRLEEITGPGSALQGEWGEIHQLIKMCQTLNRSAREMDALRTSDGAP